MSEQSMPGFMVPDEPRIMAWITGNMMNLIEHMGNQQNIPMPVLVNAMSTVMARVAMLAILDKDEEDRDGQAFEMEAFRRVIDAVASMEDYRDRKAPWRLQSSKLKAAERDGASVLDVSDMKATKQ